MKKTILLIAMLIPFFVISQSLTSVTPNSALQGETLSLTISGNNMDFDNASCAWGTIAGFRFSQSGGANMFLGTSTSTSGNNLYGDVTVPAFQPTGPYDLEVQHCEPWQGWQWISLPNSFYIYAPSWDCTNGSCVETGNGSGQYTSLPACQSACGVAESWDCNPTTNICSDPGDGSGAYANAADCWTDCVGNAINEENSGLLIYPNPAKNTLITNGNYTSITIYNIFGKEVLATDYQKTIDVTDLSSGIYFIRINTHNGNNVKKITITK